MGLSFGHRHMHKIDHTSQRIAYSKLAASKTELNRKQRQSEERGGSGDPTQTSIFFSLLRYWILLSHRLLLRFVLLTESPEQVS